MKTPYPEHEKLKALDGKNQTVGDFIGWLGEQGMEIASRHEHDDCRGCGYHSDELQPIMKSREQLIAEFFEIDQKKISDEKDAMVDEMRRLHGA